MKYVCELCGYVYDEEAGYPIRKIAPGTTFENLPEYFACPSCGSEKEAFAPAAPKQTPAAQRDYAFWTGAKYSDHSSESQR